MDAKALACGLAVSPQQDIFPDDRKVLIKQKSFFCFKMSVNRVLPKSMSKSRQHSLFPDSPALSPSHQPLSETHIQPRRQHVYLHWFEESEETPLELFIVARNFQVCELDFDSSKLPVREICSLQK